MPRSHKPRKAYRPGRVDTDPAGLAMARAALLPAEPRRTLYAPVQRALDGLRTAKGGWAAWCGLADAMNVAEQLALRGIASNLLGEIEAAQAALQALHARHTESGSWTLRAAELKALDDGVFVHRVQLEHCTQGELHDAIQAVQRRVAQALAGNAPRDARMCVGELGGKAA